jgi:hypothetical protein
MATERGLEDGKRKGEGNSESEKHSGSEMKAESCRQCFQRTRKNCRTAAEEKRTGENGSRGMVGRWDAEEKKKKSWEEKRSVVGDQRYQQSPDWEGAKKRQRGRQSERRQRA